jgi:tRNA pseudouridine13 synthase
MPQPGPCQIDDPLPHRFFTDDEGIGGAIKARAEDFVVDELPLYEPCGAGEHLYLRLEKRDVAHGELMSCLRRRFNVRERDVGYSGMKDKRALTFQTVSIHTTEDPADLDLGHDRVRVLWATRHRNKIKRGHHRGNRFSIRVRDVDPVRAPVAMRILRRLERLGAPGYFGEQRFGYRHNNHVLGALLLAGRWQHAVDELLGGRGTPFPAHQAERRAMYDAGRYADAATEWTTADRAELIAIKTLRNGGRPRDAVHAIGRTTLNFWSSALVSAAFNTVLDRRLADGTAAVLLDGDVAFKHENGACFAVDAAVLAEPRTAERLARLEISPTGPLWGTGMMAARGAAARVDEEAWEATGVSLEEMAASPYRPEGGRRPFRGPIENVDVEGGFDEHGSFIRLVFDLRRGFYATEVLREVMKSANRALDAETERGGDG